MNEPDLNQQLQFHFQRANVLHAARRFDEAIGELQCIFRLAPDLPEAHFNMGNVLRDSGNLLLSIEAYIAAVRAAETRGWRYPDALVNLGDAFLKDRRVDHALTAFGEAVQFAPRSAEAWMGLGLARYEKRDFQGAIEAYATGLDIDPLHTGMLNNTALTWSRLGLLDTALRYYDELVRRAPDLAEGHTDRALTLLTLGRYREGLAEYEWRWKMARLGHTRHRTGRPEWQGEDLTGKTVVCYGEQGYGDAFQFSRYLPLLTAMGAYVIALVERPVIGPIGSVPGVVEVVGSGATPPPHDYAVAMMSLPYWCGTLPSTIPAKVPYIFADPDRSAYWRALLAPLPGLKVGVVWAGRPEHPFDFERSMSLSALSPLQQLEDVSFIALQQGPRADEQGLDVFRPGKLADFGETAAIIDNLDLVIAVDTSVVHLAGAMGKPTWLMLPLIAEWRWALEPDTCPWYPTMRLFRQSVRDDWTGPVQRVLEELRARDGKASVSR